MAAGNSFSWNHYLPGLAHTMEKYGIDPHPAIDLLFAASFLLILSFFLGRVYRKGNLIEPGGKAHQLVGCVIERFYSLVQNNVGEAASRVFWLMMGFFVFVLTNNLLGVIPGFNPPTDKFSITFGLGLVSFCYYNYLGLQRHKFGYVKHFLGPVLWLAPLIFVIELISHFARPLTLGMRLFGNMVGDHTVLSVFSDKLFPVIVPVPFMFLGLFVACVQAFVFLQLSMIYVAGSMEDAH